MNINPRQEETVSLTTMWSCVLKAPTFRSATVALCLIPGITSSRTADLPPQQLLVYGGGGGTSFTRTCGDNRVMTGFQYRRGLVFDAIGLLCRPVQSNGSLGSESAGSLAGGSGGSFGSRSCPAGSVVTGGAVEYGSVIETFRIYCRNWKPATRSFGTSEVVVSIASNNATLSVGRSRCDNATQPVISIRGRAQMLVDAVGFTCDEP
jgi:hypothetical protein